MHLIDNLTGVSLTLSDEHRAVLLEGCIGMPMPAGTPIGFASPIESRGWGSQAPIQILAYAPNMGGQQRTWLVSEVFPRDLRLELSYLCAEDPIIASGEDDCGCRMTERLHGAVNTRPCEDHYVAATCGGCGAYGHLGNTHIRSNGECGEFV